MKPAYLRCEYLTNPLGIDVKSPRLSWINEPSDGDGRGLVQFAYQVIVSSNLEDLDKGTGDLWDTGKVNSDKSSHVEYTGRQLHAGERCFWKVKTWSNLGDEPAWDECPTAWWEMGPLVMDDWHGAAWIGAPAKPPRTVLVQDTTRPGLQQVIASEASPLLRKDFSITGQPAKAVLYITALGEYEARINGARVGNRFLAPEWTDYGTRVQFQAYDVSHMVNEGENTFGAMLADGWYMGLLGPGDKVRQRYYGTERRLLACLVVTTPSGKSSIVTDGSWQVNPEGPVRSSDHFLGESYDASFESPGWDRPGFDPASWKPALVDTTILVNLVAQMNEPIRVFKEFRPRTLIEQDKGTFIFDMGQNIVGFCKIRLGGPRGTEVIVRHGEMLDDDGTLHVDNLRLAAATDTYMLDGSGTRWFQPRFTFHGFRYVEVTGLDGNPTLDDIVGLAFSSDPPVAGAFECSNPMLNQLWRNILWTQRDNMHSIPTDCPQRNERMGWMGDAQVFAQTAIYNMDMAAFFSKFTRDMRDAQGEEGMYTDFAPHPFPTKHVNSFGPGWADCGIIIPWRMYTSYGDTRILKEHYDSMKRYVDLIIDENPDGIWKFCGSNYGDWLHGDTIKDAEGYPHGKAELPKDVYATYFYFLSTSLLSKIAGILGKDKDKEYYASWRDKVRAAFRAAFVDGNKRIKGDTQSAYAMALGFGIHPENEQATTLERLLAALGEYDNRLSTGFISTPHMMLELSARGQNELAYALAESKRFPSWGYTIENGATTIWERWDGYVKGRGFQDKGMNSFNHYSIGAVGEWFYRIVLGINFDESSPGMERVVLEGL